MNGEQLKTILWLRWRLMSNQWRRTGGLGAILSLIIGAGAVVMAAAMFAGGLCGGIFGLREASPQVMMTVWLIVTVFFLFFWMIGLLTELQRSETIDLQKLMHLPIGLGQMFVVNYLVSHFSLSIILAVPLMIGLGIGLMISRGPQMFLLIPLALSMVLMATAWTYYLRGWLATMMTNPRRRRTVIMSISLVFILVSQGPNLYFNIFQNREALHGNSEERQQQREAREAATKQIYENLIAAQGFLPPLWVPLGAQRLTEGNPFPALLGTLGCLGLATLGLRLAYRSTLQFYHGKTGGKAPVKISGARKNSGPRDKSKTTFLERLIPLVPEQSAAVALATLRSQLRAPEVKMAWGTSLIVTIILGGSFAFRAMPNLPDIAKLFIATGSAVLPIYFLAQFFGNQFGFDRDGFRALILSPAERHLILLGKNLAGLPVVAMFGGLLITLTAVRLHLPLPTVLATLLQLASLILMAGLAGNLLSILVPYRIQPGTMKPTKLPGMAMLVNVLFQMMFPVALLPVFFGPLMQFLWHRLHGPDSVPVNLIGSALLCGLMGLVYWQSLAPLGRLLYQRETKILGVITVEVE